MNFRVGPGGQILNITGDVEQNCDFSGCLRGTVLFRGGGLGPPGSPGTPRDPRGPRVRPSRTRGLSSMLRYATTLRFRIASLSNRFASSLRFRIASMNSLRFESLRFRIASLRIGSLSNLEFPHADGSADCFYYVLEFSDYLFSTNFDLFNFFLKRLHTLRNIFFEFLELLIMIYNVFD